MKFKYMLRGLGIGIVITAAAMGAYERNARASAVADARVAVLREYGIGEEPVLVINGETQEDTQTQTRQETSAVSQRDEAIESEIESVIESAKAAETQTADETTQEESKSEESKAEESKSEESKSEESKSQESSSEASVPKTIDITVTGGDDSGKVSRKLYNAGIVDSADEFDAFLMQHGYDKRITVGTKTIDIDDTWQEIAEKLTK